MGSTPILAEESDGIDVTLQVTGISDPAGEIFAGLYDTAGWSGDHFLSAAHVTVKGSDVTLHLKAPTPGEYAIRLFQDLKGTGKMAKNFLGIPTEPYAFSNNAKGSMGPPDFSAAAFEVTADGARQEVRLQ
jgi:uncharacterized protein (DUF2141 family)